MEAEEAVDEAATYAIHRRIPSLVGHVDRLVDKGEVMGLGERGGGGGISFLVPLLFSGGSGSRWQYS